MQRRAGRKRHAKRRRPQPVAGIAIGGESSMKKTLALLSSLLLSACVSAPPTTPQTKEIAPQSLGLSGPAAPAYSRRMVESLSRSAGRPAGGSRRCPAIPLCKARWPASARRKRNCPAPRAEDLPQVTLDGQEQRLLFSKDYIIPPPYGGTYRWYRPGASQSQLESGFLGQAGRDHRPGPRQRRGGVAGRGGGAAGAVGRVGPDLYQSAAGLSGYRYRRSRPWRSARKS